MLQEIMRRGTSTLGTDVPSEREINRLAARNEEEFWLFEKMDEERRRRENYRARLMEEHEVPEWAYTAGEKHKEVPEADAKSSQILGKRRRKEVVYYDTLSDVQWMKAVEGGEDVPKAMVREKRRPLPPDAGRPGHSETPAAAAAAAVNNSSEQNMESNSPASEGSDDASVQSPDKLEPGQFHNEGDGEDSAGTWTGDMFSWRTHKRKRSTVRLGL